jgi:peroxiredoxin
LPNNIETMQNHLDLLPPEKLGSLQDDLEGRVESFLEMAPKEVSEVILDRIKALAESDILELALKEGDVAPDFCLSDTEGYMVSSVDLRASGPLVVTFFRGNWCPFCDSTLRMLRKYAPYFKARGATLIAISPQTPDVSAKIVAEAGLNFPVLSDTNSEFAQACNIAYVMEEVLRPIYDQFGIDLVQLNGEDSFILPIPATYVIQPDGRISYSFLETDYTKRAEPIDVLNALPPPLKPKKRRSLNENVEFELSRLREQHPEKKFKSMFEEIERLKASGIEASALQAGDKAPDFKLYGRDGHLVDSKKLRKQGPVIVTFYHGQSSPLCMMALESMQKFLSKFEAKGASLVAITPAGSADDLHTATVTSGAKFPLLNDLNNKVSKQFGVAHEIVPPFAAGDDDERPGTLPMAATYVIDQAGMIVYSFVDCDHTKRAEPKAVLKALPAEPPKYSRKRGPFSLLFGKRIAHRFSNNDKKAIRTL